MTIEAMKQALEAMETIERFLDPLAKWQIRRPKDGGPMITIYPQKVAEEAITSLRQAIEQAERFDKQPTKILSTEEVLNSAGFYKAEKQEPVLCINPKVIDPATGKVRNGTGALTYSDSPCAGWSMPLYTTPQPQRELNCVCGAVWEGDEMVCVPHKRAWVGLTDEEIALVCAECAASAHNWNDISFARAIEAKLKEKNT